MMMTRFFRLFVALILLNGKAATASELPILSGEDVFELQYASNPVISPDGNWVLYTHVAADSKTDKFTQTLVWHNLLTGEFRQTLLKYSIISAPVWHSDSTHYAISVEKGGDNYILLVRPGKTNAFHTYQTEVAAKNLAWGPDNKSLIFNGFVETPQKRLVAKPVGAKNSNWASPVIEIQRDIYRRDGQGYLRHGHHQLFLLDIESKLVRQLTHTSFDHTGPFTWADASTVYFSGQLFEDWEHQPRKVLIYSIKTTNGKISPAIDINGPAEKPLVMPGGKVAFLGYVDDGSSYQQHDLFVYNLAKNSYQNVTSDFDRDITDIQTRSNERIYFRYDDHGVGKVGYYDFALKSLETDLVSNVGGTSIGRPYPGGSFSISDKGDLSYTLASLTAPAEIATYSKSVITTVTKITKPLTTSRKVSNVERFTYSSSYDNREIDGWVVYPPGYDSAASARYPLILEIHGGPFANYGSRFAMEPQLLAAAGYVVVYTNPRGSTSYGEEFAQLIDHDYPQQGDYEDLMSAVDYSIKHYHADPNRLYVTGGSGGGILTAWLVTKTDRFKAAVSQKPVINWETLAYTSDGYFYFTKYWFDGTPTENPSEYRRRSPLTYVDKVSTPTMLMTGEQDWRTPITESEQFYQGLKLQGVDTMLIRVPNSSHSIAARPSRIWMKLDYINAWFTRYR